ncbi:hypothetical protein SAMN02745206_03325 [Desulfacinum infernum DSM 9756]|uniref:Uncharacterized protein n=1 Tax=Desulfacinum infernum DSM 9756 TaxID=1121391 RepID=A0A1M5HC62_9BACT|nr:SidJ-related pseudokinase [Desulfacinum infernum]SHG13536.1 hypothetical protein SAMN02745206_03325 [Desulfacinum infernum DSM 9756]
MSRQGREPTGFRPWGRIKDEMRRLPSDFAGAYLKVQELNRFLLENPGSADHEAVRLVRRFLTHRPYLRQRQALFFCKEAATGLRLIMENCPGRDVVEHARRVLESLALEGEEPCQRASSEVLGGLPLALSPPDMPLGDLSEALPISLPELLKRLADLAASRERGPAALSRPQGWLSRGRSLILDRGADAGILVVKTASEEQGAKLLLREIGWMRFLWRWEDTRLGRLGGIPLPLKLDGRWLFRLTKRRPSDVSGPGKAEWAVAFRAPRGYFCYPNQPCGGRLPSKAVFLETLCRNALYLGRLASRGVVHTAPIPLFHNRVQQHRRNDGGVYRWPRGGRLDRWLESCDFPNFGRSGIRDLEHLEPAGASGVSLYEQVGMHLLSFLLVTGSYFRNRDPGRRGLQADGSPVDARHLFDRAFLTKAVRSVFEKYYEGFTEGLPAPEPGWDLEHLARRMIEEMGVDRHMEEILRVPDQEQMTDEEFIRFLTDRGFPSDEAGRYRRGREEIVLRTGPHLGAFNDRISLPEMIRFVGAASALCISGRYFHQRRGFAGEALPAPA